jgi:hypothetical protein
MQMIEVALPHDRTGPLSKMTYEFMIYGRSTMKMVLMKNSTSVIREAFGQEHGSREAKETAPFYIGLHFSGV